jgi:GTP-binding protein Era
MADEHNAAQSDERNTDRPEEIPAGQSQENTQGNTAENSDAAPGPVLVDHVTTEFGQEDLLGTLEGTRSGFVAILGKPNVGKSTLLNTLLGVKVSPITTKPQTSRRGVRGIYTEDGCQVVFVDTPGYHQSSRPTALDEYMKREVRSALIDVQLVLWVVDLRRPPGDEDRDVARLLKGINPDIPVWLIGNKVDAAKYPDEALQLYEDLHKPQRVVAISALNDPLAVYDLRADIMDLMPEGPYFFPDNIRSDQSRETWAAELIRESAMVQLREELPYTVAVQVTEWREAVGDKPIVISAEIWVERMNHRPMVIGKGGRMIREIGRNARRQLEVFLDHAVYLDLEVVVRRDWREDRESLRELGYES